MISDPLEQIIEYALGHINKGKDEAIPTRPGEPPFTIPGVRVPSMSHRPMQDPTSEMLITGPEERLYGADKHPTDYNDENLRRRLEMLFNPPPPSSAPIEADEELLDPDSTNQLGMFLRSIMR